MILGNPPKNDITLLKYNIALFLDQNNVFFYLSCPAVGPAALLVKLQLLHL